MGLLSGGQRQAASLLMATLAPIKVLLLDEHTAALDPRTAESVVDLTRRLVAEGCLTTLMITHSMQQAIALGDRLLMLHEGQVVLDHAGPAKAGLTVRDLLDEFARLRGGRLDEDALLLG
jgi:putative ABC transport system ATP-binding protein